MLKILRLLRLARIAYKLELLTQSGVAQKWTYKSISFHEFKITKSASSYDPWIQYGAVALTVSVLIFGMMVEG